MAVTVVPSPEEANLAQLRLALEHSDPSQLRGLPSWDVPTTELEELLQHPQEEFRGWGWMNGGEQVLNTAMNLIWYEHSLEVACDYVRLLGSQAFYEDYYYFHSSEQDLSTLEFLWQIAPAIGYPDLEWATATTEDLLTLALRNPELNLQELRRVYFWAAAESETTPEALLLQEELERRRASENCEVQVA